MNVSVRKFRKIEEAKKCGYEINMAFHRYTRNLFPCSKNDGVLIDINFFITKILGKINSEFSKKILSIFIEIFKTNNDYCMYLNETGRLQKLQMVYSSEINSPPSINVKNLRQGYSTSTTGIEVDNIIKEILGDEYNNNDIIMSDDEDDDDNSDDNKNSENEEENDSTDKITVKNVSEWILYFNLKHTSKVVSKMKLKNIQNLLLQSCVREDVMIHYCVLMYYNTEKKYYRFLTRQVKTARGVLSKQSDILICGWSGMIKNISKTLLLSSLKNFKNNYNLKRTQIYDIDDLDTLIDDITYVIKKIEGVEEPQQQSPPPSHHQQQQHFIDQILVNYSDQRLRQEVPREQHLAATNQIVENMQYMQQTYYDQQYHNINNLINMF